MSDANRTAIRYAREASFKVSQPAIPADTTAAGSLTLFNLRFTKSSLDAQKQTVLSDEIRSDRQVSAIVQVGQSATGGFGTELLAGDYDSLIASIMQADALTSVTATADLRQTILAATATVTLSGNAANGNTLIIAGKTYTFRTSVTTEGDILVGVSQATSIQNLIDALLHTGTPGTQYIVAAPDPNINNATFSSNIVTLTAQPSGSAGNSITISSPSFTVATFAGGEDAQSITSSGTDLSIFSGQKFIKISGATTPANNGIKPIISVTSSQIILGSGSITANQAGATLTITCDGTVANDSLNVNITQSGANTVYTVTGGTFSAATKGARYVRISNADEDENNGIRKIVSCTSTVLTVVTSALGFTGESGADIIVHCNYIRTGTTFYTHVFEELFLDVPHGIVFTGVGMDTLDLTVDSQKICTLNFTTMGYKGQSRTSSIAASGTIIAGTTNTPINAAANIGTLTKDGTAMLNPVKSIALKVNNNLRARPIIGDLGTTLPGSGRSEVTGSMEVYFANKELLEEYLNHVAMALEFQAVDINGNTLNFFLPSVQSSSGTPQATGVNTDVMQTLAFSAFANPALGYQFQIDRLKNS